MKRAVVLLIIISILIFGGWYLFNESFNESYPPLDYILNSDLTEQITKARNYDLCFDLSHDLFICGLMGTHTYEVYVKDDSVKICSMCGTCEPEYREWTCSDTILVDGIIQEDGWIYSETLTQQYMTGKNIPVSSFHAIYQSVNVFPFYDLRYYTTDNIIGQPIPELYKIGKLTDGEIEMYSFS